MTSLHLPGLRRVLAPLLLPAGLVCCAADGATSTAQMPPPFTTAWAENDCAPWDGAATTIYLATSEPDSTPLDAPYLRLTAYQGRPPAGTVVTWPGEQDEGGAFLCPAEGACRTPVRGRIRFVEVLPDSVMHGRLLADVCRQHDPRRRFPRGVETETDSLWLGVFPSCRPGPIPARSAMHPRKLPLVLLAIAAPLAAQQPVTAPPRDLDAYVQRTMREFEVPGLALAIVKDGRVVVARGYGVRKLGDPTPVDGQTLFGIASNTKLFTATALAILVEEGKVEWDAPVIRYLPWFQMYDPYVTREITVRDLLVHRSGLGLGAGDLLWWPPSTYNRHEIARRLRFIRPAAGFRTRYAYDNVLYSVAGEVIEAVSGQTWEEFVTSHILQAVGMTGSNVLHSAAGSGGNVAATHARIDGRVRPVNPFASDNTNPAGGVNAGAEDIAKWLMVQLDSGRIANRGRLFSQRNAVQLWSDRHPDPDRKSAA